MALVGDGRGFRILVILSALVVLLTLPLMLIELRSPGLSLARDDDQGYAAVEVRLNHLSETIEIVTRLSAELPGNYPLIVAVQASDIEHQSLAHFTAKEFIRDIRRPDLLVIRGPIKINQPDAWRGATIACQIQRNDTALFSFSGHYVPPNLALVDVTITRPGDN